MNISEVYLNATILTIVPSKVQYTSMAPYLPHTHTYAHTHSPARRHKEQAAVNRSIYGSSMVNIPALWSCCGML